MAVSIQDRGESVVAKAYQTVNALTVDSDFVDLLANSYCSRLTGIRIYWDFKKNCLRTMEETGKTFFLCKVFLDHPRNGDVNEYVLRELKDACEEWAPSVTAANDGLYPTAVLDLAALRGVTPSYTWLCRGNIHPDAIPHELHIDKLIGYLCSKASVSTSTFPLNVGPHKELTTLESQGYLDQVKEKIKSDPFWAVMNYSSYGMDDFHRLGFRSIIDQLVPHL